MFVGSLAMPHHSVGDEVVRALLREEGACVYDYRSVGRGPTGSSIIHIADSDRMMAVLNSVEHSTVCLLKDGVAVTDGALYARKLQIRRACYALRLCGHPLYADAAFVKLGDDAELSLHAQLPADEDAAAAIFADPQAEDVSPPVPFPRDQGAPVNVAVRRHVERDVFVE